MAALPLNQQLHRIKVLRINNTKSPSILPIINCQKHDRSPEPEESKQDSSSSIGFLGGVMKIGKGLKESLSPKRKGDWKDVVLMSLSFAVYVYMSQKIVCAYCAWMSMSKQLHW